MLINILLLLYYFQLVHLVLFERRQTFQNETELAAVGDINRILLFL